MKDNSLPVGPPVSSVPSMRPPARTTYEGDHVRLSPLNPEADIEELFTCSHGTQENDRLWTYMPYGPFTDQDTMFAWLKQMADSDDPLVLTVFNRASKTRVGVVSFMNIVAEMRRLELGGIWYAPVVQRTKVNTEAMYLMLKTSFDELNYRRVEWKCDALNARSRAAALRLGFSFEGVFLQHMTIKGRNRDSAYFAMMDHQWPTVKANMERWLYDEEAALSLTDLNAKIVGSDRR